MKLKFYGYPPCSTVKKAQTYLENKGATLDYINIKETPPSVEELKQIHKDSKLPLKRLFNTSGNSYKALNLKETFDNYSEDELYKLLSEDGMLIKRPLIIGKDFTLIGFKPSDVDQYLYYEKK